MNRKEYNRRAVKEYKSQSSTILQNYLIQRRYAPALLIRYDRFSSDTGEDTKLPFCETVFAAVMLADISGFTKLASQLNVEELKRHIKYVPLLCACLLFASNFFTLLLGSIIRRNKGDVIKFCGDAVLIMWSCPMTASAQIKRSCAIQATKCGLELLQNYGNYDSGGSGPNDKVVSLRLHCGMSVGPLHCMSLGTPQRMEFLISGRILHEMGVAENHSQLGEICLSQSAYELVENDFDGQHVTPETVKILGPKLTHRSMRQSNLKGNPLKSSVISVSKLLPRHQKKRHRVYVDTVYDDEGDEPLDLPHQISKGVGSLLQGQIENKDFKVALIRYVHESARKFILDSSDFIAEIRLVCTLFIQILNLDDDFNEGRPQRPQQVLLEILDILKRLGGALRQYVVDDKGCVVICNFGVSGFCSTNDPLRAVSAAMSIKDHLKECDVSCRIGVTQGMAYCGYVGSKDRKEFTVMGSCVNLAARLMGKASESQILVDTKIFLHTETDFEYDQTLPKIEAKGYSTPVQVYSPLSYHDDNNNTNRHFSMEEIVSQSHKTKLVPLVGRSYELSLLSHAISKILGQCSPHGHSAGAPPSSSMLTNPTSLKHKQMSLRATLSQIIEESSTKTAGNDIAISSSQSFNFDEKFFSPRLSLVSPVAHGPSHATAAHLSSHSSSQDDNIYVIVGGPGYGKTTLINEVIARNASLMSPTIRISCHVSCMYEPYEVIGSLLEELMSHASLPPMATSTANKVRRNSSPRRRRRSSQDIFNSISEDEESFAGLGAGSQLDSPSNSHRSASITSIPFLPHEDPEYLRKQTKENLFESLCSWIEYNMPDTLFEYISSENIWKGSMSNSRSTIKIDSKEEEGNSNGGGGGLLAPHLLPERMASCLKSRSSRRFSVTSSVGGGIGGITISNKTKIFTAVELVPLLRICLNTEELPSSQLLAEFTSNGLEDMIASLVSEVLTQLLSSTRSKCMVIEDLHWCDKRSFEALMLTLSILEPDSFFLGSMRSMESSRSSRKSYAQILSSEGSVAINSLDDLHIDCQILELHPFTKSDVKHFIENTLGTSLLKESPNVLSDENVSRILGRSNSVPGEVAEQVKELEMQITRAKYGILDRMGGGGAGGGGRGYGSHQEENLLLYDELSKESQMIVKIAAVCGMTFPLGLLLHTLTEMGYKALLSNVERSLNQLEDKAIFKRVAYAPESIKRNESQSHLISVKSRYFRADTNSLSLRQTVAGGAGGAGGRQQSQQQSTPGGGSADPMKRFYTFLNKSFRELIYSLMLTTQRTTAHALIGDFLANEYQEMQGPHDCQEAEALAYHYSKANDQLKEVYYTVEAAKLFQNQFKILTAFQHFHQLVVLSTRYDSIEEILQHCCARAVRASYHDIFVRTLFKQINFGPHFISTRYLEREEFVQPIHSVCSFIPSTHLSNFIAEMSILKFKLCHFNMSNNLFHLACHIRKMNTPLSLPPSFYVKKYPSRCLFGTMFFHQGNLSLLRGYPQHALKLFQQALAIMPPAEFSSHCQILCAISTTQLFVGSLSLADEYLIQAENLKVSVQFKESHCYLKLHGAILSFANGDFIETQRRIGIAATKYTNPKDLSPIRFQVENLLDWSYFAAGDINLLGERINSTLSSLSGDDIPVGSMWYLQLQSLCEILRGHFITARQCLGSLGRYQKDHFGFYYQTSLMAFLLTCERKYLSADPAVRYEALEKIIFAGRKLLERVQTSPIGMISLFLISYSALAVLISTKPEPPASAASGLSLQPPLHVAAESSPCSSSSHHSHHTPDSKAKEMIFRPGGGLESRLETIARSCYESLVQLSSNIKCLGILCGALQLKLACYSGRKVKKFTLDVLEDFVYTIEYQQFAFGLLFWHLEKQSYCREFHRQTLPLGALDEPFGRNRHRPSAGASAGGTEAHYHRDESVDDMEMLLQKYHIPDHHFILTSAGLQGGRLDHQQQYSPKDQHPSQYSQLTAGSLGVGGRDRRESPVETTTVTPFSSL